MFEKAKLKLEESRMNIEQLRQSKDAISFRVNFNAYINNARAITNAMQKDGKKIEGFEEWYSPKQKEMGSDELLRFIHKARTEDFH